MCEFKKRLAGIFDRSEALPGEAQMLFEHAGGCLECGGLFNLLADADRALAQLAGAGAEVITPFEAVFLDFDSVRKRMEAREAEARGKRRFVIGYAAAAAMAFVSILAFAAYYFIADDGFRERGFMVKPHSEIFCVDAFPDGRREILDPLSLF
ncbi:MAG: hypothetical protein FJ088_00575, partial [Deltaproteobacteria bacterium]|nr:hypothetical protein [Deltaproteobacteria bacterium]